MTFWHARVLRQRSFAAMSAAPEVPPGLLQTIVDWLWAVVLAFGTYIWKTNGKRLDEIKVDFTETQSLQAGEIARIRDTQAKLFDKLSEHQTRAEQRHIEILNALHTGLDRKADK